MISTAKKFLLAMGACLVALHACAAHQGAIKLFVNAENQIFALETFDIPQMVEYLGIEISVDGPGFGVDFPINGVTVGAELYVDVAFDLLYWDGVGLTDTSARLEMETPFFDNQGVPNETPIREYYFERDSGAQSGMFWGTYNGAQFWEAHGLNFMVGEDRMSLDVAPGIYGAVIQIRSQLHDTSEPFVIPFVYDPLDTWDPVAEMVGVDRLREATAAIALADLNRDGHLTTEDIDGLVAEIVAGTHSNAFDLTEDGLVDNNDLSEWLAQAGTVKVYSGAAFLPGDANLDGAVDGSDFVAWNDAKFTSTAAWSQGDFNGDGAVDGQDMILWNDHKFTASDTILSVPEPMNVAVMAWAMIGWFHLRRRV